MDPSRAMSQYIRDRWGPEQGFPRGPVYAITQTSDGYLWIGTEAGLVRFDGWNFRMISDSSRNFKIANVLGLTPAPDGSLWVRLQGRTLLRYRNGVFESAPSTLAGCQHHGHVPNRSRGSAHRQERRSRAASTTMANSRCWSPNRSCPAPPCCALAQMPDGTLWMGTRDAGTVSARRRMRHLRFALGCPTPRSTACCRMEASGLWIGTDNGIARWNGTALTSAGLPAGMNRFQALAMIRDRDGNLWVGTDSRGLVRLNAGWRRVPG